MFVTFYSYKGGVGRTLALANVAYLLASHKKEPCKILLWDFDLEAPGLQQIFKISSRGKKQGFVDLVYTYLEKAKMPTLGDYIHKTDINKVDILPAGYINKTYSNRLEKINWVTLYKRARGYDFIETLKKQIEAFKYDYVLIDSRTGYSDVGNICVSQLADLAILFFRPNNQNIEGTKKVFDIIIENNKKTNKNVSIIPVVSPLWPFIGNIEADKQVEKVHNLFAGSQLLEVSFDSSLTYKEKIICKDINKVKIKTEAKIFQDYENLAKEIRLNNPDDPITIEQSYIEKRREVQFAEAFELAKRLVELRPNNEIYWRRLLNAATLERNKRKELFIELENIISDFMAEDSSNPFVYFARAELRNISKDLSDKDNLNAILQDYNKALELKPDSVSILVGRAEFYRKSLKNFEKSLEDFSHIIKIEPKNLAAYHLRGLTYIEKKEYMKAIEDFQRILGIDSKDLLPYFNIARAYFYIGEFDKANNNISKYLKSAKKNTMGQVLYCHIMAALGKREESLFNLKLAEDIHIDPLDRIEILIMNFELKKALTDLNSRMRRREGSTRNEIILRFLKLCILILMNEEDRSFEKELEEIIKNKGEILADLAWSYEELKVFLANSFKKGLIKEEQEKKISDLIKKMEG